MGVSGQFHAPAAFPQGKSPWYPLDMGLGGSQSWSGNGGKEKNSQPPPEIERSSTIIQPVAQRYTTELSLHMWYTAIEYDKNKSVNLKTQRKSKTWFCIIYSIIKLKIVTVRLQSNRLSLGHGQVIRIISNLGLIGYYRFILSDAISTGKVI
jgi:hypothetical protein